jgi:hypothetical protein
VSLLKKAPSFNNSQPVDSASYPALFRAGASASPLARRGGEGLGGGSAPAYFSETPKVEFKGVWSPRCVTSPARAPVLPAHLWLTPRTSVAAMRGLSPAGRLRGCLD